MTLMIHAVEEVPEAKRSIVATAGFVVLFWLLAAFLVLGAHVMLDGVSADGSAAVQVGAIAIAAYAYIRFAARKTLVVQALFVGITWLLLDIAAEIGTTTMLGRGWYELIGSLASPGIRTLMLFAWIVAPALFCRHE